MLRRYPFLEATARYAASIDTIARKAGAADKFNTTITLAFLSLIAERMHAREYESVDAFLTANPDLVSGNPLKPCYTPERLGSDLARSVFLMPDVEDEMMAGGGCSNES